MNSKTSAKKEIMIYCAAGKDATNDLQSYNFVARHRDLWHFLVFKAENSKIGQTA
jgi:hypothetical protein